MDTEAISREYPEHAKLAAVSAESQAIGEFLDFGLGLQGLILATESVGLTHNRLVPTSRSIPAILAIYFGIDQQALETEKRAMLAAMRDQNA